MQPLNPDLLDLQHKCLESTNTKAVEELGYQPRPLEEGIRLTMTWYKENYGKKSV